MRIRLLAIAAFVAVFGALHPSARQPAVQPPAVQAASPSKEPTISPSDNLVVEGLPPIPASIAESVGRYTEFRGAGFADWHPTRREMLISTRFGDVPQVHLVKMPGGARQQLTFFPDRVGGASFEPQAGEYFVFGKDRGGDEFAQAYRYDLQTGAVTMFTDGGRSQNYPGPWSTARDRMAYSSTKRNGADRDVYVIDPRDPATERRVLEAQGGGWGALDWSPDDRTLLVGQGVSVNESYLWLVDLATGERKLLTPKVGQPVSYGDAEFAADGKGVFVTTDKDNEFKRLARIDLATGAHTYYTSDIPWDVEGFDLSEDGRTIAFTTNEEGLDVLRLLDVATGKEKPKPQLGLGPGIMGGVSWHRNGRDLAFSYNSAQSANDVYSIDVTTGKVERWTESEIGGLNASSFAPAELVRWKSFDGKTISGFLYKPPSSFTGRRPVVINIHGGPEGQAVPSFLGRNNYYLNELGVAVIFPNVRGSTGFGKTFVALDNGMKREDSVRDIGALLDWVATRPDLDASRVMVTGGSYGGYMTLAVATHYDDRIRCSLDVVGISNFVTFLQNTEAYRRDLRRVEYGDERDPAMKAFLEKISPMTNAAAITKPMFIVQGRNDPRVPYTESQQMVETIRRNNGPVWYLMANDEGHGFAKKKNQDFLFYATVTFMKQFLLN
jgi:dipeptidyl aminopeptidase/acylaminoacyl peptidase